MNPTAEIGFNLRNFGVLSIREFPLLKTGPDISSGNAQRLIQWTPAKS